MKKLKEKLRKLSLTQQLVSIVVLMLVFFLVFFFGSLTLKVDAFVDKQMYGLIHRAQQNVIYNYIRNLNDADLYGANDPNIIHIIGTKDGKYTSNGMNLIDRDLLQQIKYHMDTSDSDEVIDYRYGDKGLYTIANIPNRDATIATIISADYHDEFKSTLLSSVINILLLVMGVVFLILLIWVTTLIHPLNQIREYINKIRNNEEADLAIDRGDEIGELAHVLVEMNDEIDRQEQLKEEMIQNISHDLKTPIATIKSYGESIKDGIYPYETLEKSVDVIIEHADRLEKKVFNLLMLNRMDYLVHEELEDCQILDTESIVEQVIVSSRQFRPEIDIKVRPNDEAVLYGSEEPWRVVFENLLDNALRYAKTKIIIDLKEDGFSVYNDGSEIDEDKIDSLFKAYEVGEKGQFGLGLSIVHRVVTQYGYLISAHNRDDGVEFVVRKED